MKISQLISELKAKQEIEGDIEVTCTGTTLQDDHCSIIEGSPLGTRSVIPDVFETTVENLIVGSHPNIGPCVRICL